MSIQQKNCEKIKVLKQVENKCVPIWNYSCE